MTLDTLSFHSFPGKRLIREWHRQNDHLSDVEQYDVTEICKKLCPLYV